MSERHQEAHANEPVHRRWVALALVLVLLALLMVALVDLPREGAPLPDVARRSLVEALPRFRTTEPVSAVVYGFRAFDTFGETFLLMAAVVSVIVLTRHREPRHGFIGEERAAEEEQEEEDPVGQDGPQQRTARTAEEEESGEQGSPQRVTPDRGVVGSPGPERAQEMTVVTLSAIRIVLPLLAVAGLYLVIQGYSPGGGFPAGGVVLGVILLIYTAFGYQRIVAAVRPGVFEVIELLGALAVIVVLGLGIPLAGSFAASWVPLAAQQTLRSGGIMQLFSLSEFVEVGTGLTIVVFAAMGMRHGWTPDEDDADEEHGE
jgi:multicomponent Na+:H+ antiporter subunit B